MSTKIQAAQRLQTAAAPNKIKNSVMRALTSGGLDVTRQGDSVFLVQAVLPEVTKLLVADGWSDNKQYKEFEKDSEDYTLSYVSSGSAVKLEFIYMG